VSEKIKVFFYLLFMKSDTLNEFIAQGYKKKKHYKEQGKQSI
jgi:hypothetical protein